MSFLLLHIMVSSLLVLLIVVRFLIIALASRSLATLRLSLLLAGGVTLLTGVVLLVTTGASVTHLCLNALGIITLVIGAEVWLRTTHLRRYSEDS